MNRNSLLDPWHFLGPQPTTLALLANSECYAGFSGVDDVIMTVSTSAFRCCPELFLFSCSSNLPTRCCKQRYNEYM